MLDKNNYHKFQPLLYQVAIGGLEPDTITTPIRKLFHGYKNLIFRMAEVIEIEPENNRVITDIGWIRYDYFVLASGSKTNFFGLSEISETSLGLKEITEAIDIRSWMLQNLEKAVLTCDSDEKDALTNFVIVGAGPAGVELAGALAEFKRFILNKDYPELTSQWVKIFLVEAKDKVLPGMSERSSEEALKVLRDIGVEVMLNTTVKHYDGNTVTLGDGKNLPARMMVWTAGVEGDYPAGLHTSESTRAKRLIVDKYNRVNGFENIFAIGDVAAMVSPEFPNGHPMLAPVAIQQGRLLADNLIHFDKYGAFKKKFEYADRGSLATIGKRKAIAEIGKFRFRGFFAWVLWSTVHLFSLIGFKNKVIVSANWLISYMTYEKANRLIIRKYFPVLKPAHRQKTNRVTP